MRYRGNLHFEILKSTVILFLADFSSDEALHTDLN